VTTTDRAQDTTKRRRRGLIMLVPLMLLFGMILCAGQMGVRLSAPHPLDTTIEALRTADYGPWLEDQFNAADPALATAAIMEQSTQFPTLAVVAGVFTPLPPDSSAATAIAQLPPPAGSTPLVIPQIGPTATPPDSTAIAVVLTDVANGTLPAPGTLLPGETVTPTSTGTIAASATPTMTATATDTAMPSATPTLTSTVTSTATTTNTPTNTPTGTPPPTSTPTATATISAPIANFAASTLSGTAPLTVNFTNLSSGVITGYNWSFGDGGTSGAASPSYTYTTPGTYTVVLTVSGPGGTTQAAATVDVQAVVVTTLDLGLSMNVSSAAPSEGDTITYTLNVGNSGTIPATGVQIADSLPGGLSYVSHSVTHGSYGGGTWALGNLAAGTGATLTITATVNGGTGGSTITHSAALIALNETDTNGGNNGASASITVQSPPPVNADLAIGLSVDNPTPSEGDTITYTVSVTNNGPDAASGVQVAAGLPAGITYTTHSAGQGSYGGGVWALGSLGSGASTSLTLSGTVNGGTGGSTINSSAAITALNETDPNTGNNSASVALTVNVTGTSADVGVNLGVSDSTPFEYDPITFTVSVTNNGPDPASGVQISAPVPPGLTYTTHTAGQGTYSGGTWTVGNVAVGATHTLTLDATVNSGTAGSAIPASAGITAQNESDPQGGNNADSVTVNVQMSSVNIGPPDTNYTILNCGEQLTVNMSGSPITTHSGYDLVYYEIESGSSGTIRMDSVIVEVGTSLSGPWHQVFYWGNGILDANTSVGAAGYGAGSEPDNTTIPATNPPLYGSPITTGVAIDVDAVAPAGTYTAVRVRVPGSNCSNSEVDSLQVLPELADLALSMSVDNASPPPDTPFTYTVTLTNNGSSTASSAVVDVTLASGSLTYSAHTASTGTYNSGSGQWTVGPLANGASATLDITVTAGPSLSASTVTSSAAITATGTTDPNGGNNTASVNAAVQGNDLALGMSASTTTPQVGDTITLTLTATNNGPINAAGVQVTDNLPAGLTYVSDDGGGAYSGGVWTIGAIPASGSATLTITATVTGPVGVPITKTASITASTYNDPAPGNESASATITPQALTTDLNLTQAVSSVTPTESDTITITLTVSNGGPNAASGVQITDNLPAGLTYVSDDGGGTYSGGVWTVGGLANGASAALNITARVNNGTMGTPITNAATISASDQTDPNASNNSASQTITPQGIDLSINNTVSSGNPSVGDTITYTITVNNGSPSAATGVVVSDSLPAGVNYVSDDGGGAYSGGAWTIGTIPASSSTALTITATVDATAPGLSPITNTAAISATDQSDPNGGNNTADVAITVAAPPQTADIQVSITVDNATPLEGDTITFTFTVFNTGPDAATTLDVTLPFAPAGAMSYVGGTTSQGSIDGGTYTWHVGTLNSGATATATTQAQINAGYSGQTITREIHFSSMDQVESNGSNNDDSVTINVQ
jgi:uncharacterized repeat protein (TIGR01451 family)